MDMYVLTAQVLCSFHNKEQFESMRTKKIKKTSIINDYLHGSEQSSDERLWTSSLSERDKRHKFDLHTWSASPAIGEPVGDSNLRDPGHDVPWDEQVLYFLNIRTSNTRTRSVQVSSWRSFAWWERGWVLPTPALLLAGHWPSLYSKIWSSRWGASMT